MKKINIQDNHIYQKFMVDKYEYPTKAHAEEVITRKMREKISDHIARTKTKLEYGDGYNVLSLDGYWFSHEELMALLQQHEHNIRMKMRVK